MQKSFKMTRASREPMIHVGQLVQEASGESRSSVVFHGGVSTSQQLSLARAQHNSEPRASGRCWHYYDYQPHKADLVINRDANPSSSRSENSQG